MISPSNDKPSSPRGFFSCILPLFVIAANQPQKKTNHTYYNYHIHYPLYNYLCEIAPCPILIINNRLTAVSLLSFVLVLLLLPLFPRINLRHLRLPLKAIRNLLTALTPNLPSSLLTALTLNLLTASCRRRALEDLLSLTAPHLARIPSSRFMYARCVIINRRYADRFFRDSILPVLPVLPTPVVLLVLLVVRRPVLVDMVLPHLEARPRRLLPSRSLLTVGF